MYSVSDDVIELFKNGNRQLIRITFTNGDTSLSITESDIVSGGLTIDRYCISGSKLELGSAIAAQMTLKLRNYDGEYNNITFEGGEFNVEIGIQDWEDESAEPVYIPMGVFIADESPRKQSVINITALDRMVLLDTTVNWDNFTFPITVEEIVNQTCTDCGVTLGNTISALPNYSYSVASYPSSSDITYRTLIQWCAFLLGTCAQMNYDGKLTFRWYEQTDISITPAERYSSDLYENDIVITDICYTSNSSVIYHSGDDTDYSISFSGNDLLQEDIQDALDNIHPIIDLYTYRPYEAVIYSAPFLWPLDEISYTDAQGIVHNTVITHITYTCNQNTTIAGKGETTTNESYDYTGVLESSSLGVALKSLIEKTETSILLEVSQIQESVSEQIASIALAADSIVLSVSALNNAVGVTYQNYALTSGDYTENSDLSNWFVYPTSRADYVSIAAYDGYVRIMKVSSVTGRNFACLLLSDSFTVESGVEYTYTIKYRTNDDIAVGVAIGTLYDGTVNETVSIENDITDGSQVDNWVVYTGTFTPYNLVDSDGDNYSICLTLPTNAEDGDCIDVAYIMFEKGSTAHDWEAAPEDNKLITFTDLALTIDENGIARLSANADSIELTAGQLIITSGNFTLDANGNAEFSGILNAPNGIIGGLRIAETYLLMENIQEAYTGNASDAIIDEGDVIVSVDDSSDNLSKQLVADGTEEGTYNIINANNDNSNSFFLAVNLPLYSGFSATYYSLYEAAAYILHDGRAKFASVTANTAYLGDTTVDGTLNVSGFNIPEIQHGTISVSITSASTNTSFSVTFDTEFSEIPTIVITPRHNSNVTSIEYKILTASSTGFTGYIRSSGTGTHILNWIAMY